MLKICCMTGFINGQLHFPSWLGMNSKRTRVDRIWHQMQIHTSLSIGTTKRSLTLDYGEVLRDHIIAPIVVHGIEGVNHAVSNLRSYYLLKEDLDRLNEVTLWLQNKPSLWKMVNSKTKAAFTRECKKVQTVLPYRVSNGTIAFSEADEVSEV